MQTADLGFLNGPKRYRVQGIVGLILFSWRLFAIREEGSNSDTESPYITSKRIVGFVAEQQFWRSTSAILLYQNAINGQID